MLIYMHDEKTVNDCGCAGENANPRMGCRAAGGVGPYGADRKCGAYAQKKAHGGLP